MKVPQMIAAELRRLVSTPMAVIALVALLCVPIVYGGLYLWANQDPYAKLSEIPVALVVDDTGATINDADRNIGDEVADELIDDGAFDWDVVSGSVAAAGLDDGTYDFTIEIPADFTSSIASVQTGDPHSASILLRRNDANSYLASTIGSQAVERIRTTITQKVVTEAGLTMLDALNTIRIQLTDAADGAQKLVDGLTAAGTGAAQLQSGSSDLADGTTQLSEGASALSTGVDQISSNLAQLSDGAAQVAAGTDQLDGIATQVGTASSQAITQLPTVRADIETRLQSAGLDPQQIADVLAQLDPLGDTVRTVDGRVQAAVGQIDQLNSGASQVADGSAQLSAASQTAATGAQAVATGAASAATGAEQLHDGIDVLAGGINELTDGATQLSDGLSDGAAKLPDFDDATRAKQAATLGAPVSITSSDVAQAQNYGAGLAPFFAALAAWIGIYALFLIVRPISRRAVTALHSPVRVTLAGWATPALLGAIQMVGLFAILSLALGFQFAHPLPTLGILIFASLTYTAIILALNVWLGAVGQFLGLVLMVLQLVTAGGTFPWQTLPAPLAALHHVLPMGYVVDAMRQVMYGGTADRVWLDLGVLAIWLIGAGTIAALGVTRMTHFRTLRDLQPSIIE